MTVLLFSFFLLITGIFAGFVGALTGLGGGVVIIPVLVILFHVDIHYAMGASLVSVIATSTGSAATYLKEGYTNLRIGMFLETGAIVGAVVGAMLVAYVSKSFITILFTLVLFISAYLTYKRDETVTPDSESHLWAKKLNLNGSYPSAEGRKAYPVQGVPQALGIMTMAGCLSGLLGIGAGVLKVLAMDQVMKLPYKVATTTSSFIIGITAAASIYFTHGYIDPGITFPTMLGVTAGSFLGTRLLIKMSPRFLRPFFSGVICLLGVQMIYKAWTGNL